MNVNGIADAFEMDDSADIWDYAQKKGDEWAVEVCIQ